MATEPGKNFTRLIDDIQKNGPDYSFFYAIFLCENLFKKIYPERDDEKLDQRGLKFRPYENYGFPPTNIRSVDYSEDIIAFVINFLGLYGINSPLPRCYHEQVAMQQETHGSGEVPLQNFLDIFNNRFYWLYYHAWKKYRFYLHVSTNPQNKIMQRLFTFMGQGPSLTEANLPYSPFQLLQLSGVLSNRVRSKSGLLILLQNFFPRFKIYIKEFIPTMVKIDAPPKIGKSSAENSSSLGVNCFLGRSVLDYMNRICVEIGPIDFEDYLGFTPQGNHTCLLKSLMDLYINDGLEYNLKLIIKTAGVSKYSWNDSRIKLGQNMWLGRPQSETVSYDYKYEQLYHSN